MRILLIEDSLGDAELVRVRSANMRGGAPQIDHGETLEEGIALAQKQAYDAVLLDLGLPDSLGLSTVEEFRKAVPTAPVIVFTGLDDLDTALSALRVGADDYLVKGELTSEILRRSISYAAERRRLLERARAAVQTRDEILRIVSHDMRNQMTTILAGLQLLRAEKDEAKRLRRVEQVENAVRTVRRLIGDLLDIDALENGSLPIETGLCDAGDLVQGAVTGYLPHAERAKVKLEARVACEGVQLRCDRERILQVLSNFISNAFKYTPPEGTIAIGCEREDGRVRFFVQDTGPGIPEQEASHVFDRFFRGSRPQGSGLGLGLTIAKALIEAHRGQIGVSSRPGAGARFWFTLPLS